MNEADKSLSLTFIKLIRLYIGGGKEINRTGIENKRRNPP